MADSNPADDSKYRIDRRTALKLAGLTGVGASFPGIASAGDHRGGDGWTSSDEFPGIERIEPEGPPPWEQTDAPRPEWARDLWFVEFEAPPSARGGAPAEHANERAQLRADARRQGVGFTEQRDFTTLWNGLSVEAELTDISVLRGLDSVSAVYPVALIERPEPEEVSPELDTALSMTGADNAQAELGFSGEGLSVAVVDTGIDYNHQDLGGGGDADNVIEAADDRTLDHPRITHGWDYVGGDFDASDPDSPPPDPDPDPMDAHGHGTHVAGIVGAGAATEEGATGVAPAVSFGAYKVFALGSTTADVIVEALEDAFEDGMDIVNMSLGASLAWGQEYPTTAASNELAAQGVVVANSAGNDAALGTWSLSAPANAHDIISVASADNTFLDALVFEVDQLAEPVPYLELDGAELPPTEGVSDPLALPDVSEIEGQEGFFGCEPSDFEGFPAGHVALIQRGHCTFAQKYLNAVDAGATGVVIFNNVSGLFAGTILDDGVEGVWGAGISDTSGATLVDLIEDGEEVRLGFTAEEVSVPNPTGGLVSSFSSYGQDVELAFGPSITAPGGLITSTWPLEAGAYAMLSGTSMAAPHVAGAIALLLEAEPDLDPFEVRDRLQNTAEPKPWSLNASLGLLDNAFRQGGGMLQIDRAITAENRITPGQIAVGDGTESVQKSVTITNASEEDIKYTLGHVPAIETALDTYLSGFGFFLVGADVEFEQTSVTVGSNDTVDIEMTITPPFVGLPNHQYGGYITLTPDNDEEPLRVPYSGFAGDYQSLPLLGYVDPAGQIVEQNPILSEIIYDEEGEIEDFEPVGENHTFTIREDDFPVVETFFGHFPQEMEVYAVHQESGARNLVLRDAHLPRSPGPEDFFAFAWAGTTQAGRSNNARPVQSGTYTLEVNVLRTLGERDNPEHWDTWESPEFELDTRAARGRPSQSAPQSAP